VIALKLARAGYGGGDPERILNMRVDLVIEAAQYEQFCNDYESEYIELNTEKK
jgi:hypothetical protein